MYCGKMADLIEVMFGLVGRVSQRKDVLDGGQNLFVGRADFW